MELSLKQKLFYALPVLFCFCLPFGSRLLSVIIVVWTVLSLLNLNKDNLKKGLLNKNALLMYAFFVVTLISALFSENKNEGMFSIEIKLSCLLFPYLLFCFNYPVDILKRSVVSFVSGCFFACLYLLGRSALYAAKGQPEYFFYTLFSDLIHPSYFAMYLILAITFIMLLYPKWYKGQQNIAYTSYFFALVFAIAVFLCSSKLGLISFFICIPMVLLHKWQALNFKAITVLVIAFVVIIFVSSKLFPSPFSRLSSLTDFSFANVDKTSSESTTVRVLIWEQALSIIKRDFWLGAGVGDANDVLYESYRENGLTGAYEHKLNAHNQFFQTFIGLGLIGFTLLLLLTFGQLIKAILKKHFLLFLFSLLIILNFMVESMLQTAAGILFFAFFFCLFNLVNEKELSGE